MSKFILFSLITLGFASAHADVFADYSALGNQIQNDYRNGNSTTDLSAQLEAMAELGYDIMDLYSAQFPECAEQYKQIHAEVAGISTLSYDELESRYHDGQGLPVAPKACYLGRSMVAHPYMARALLSQAQGEDRDAQFLHEVREVTERAPKIKTKLGL